MMAMFFMVVQFERETGLFLWVGVVLLFLSLLAFAFQIALALHGELLKLVFFYFKARCISLTHNGYREQ
jgi:high-affinity Fe2+/Pb2+ permease